MHAYHAYIHGILKSFNHVHVITERCKKSWIILGGYGMVHHQHTISIGHSWELVVFWHLEFYNFMFCGAG
jgi:hypothetical protein